MNRTICFSLVNLFTVVMSLGASAAEHFDANHCEIFIDKLVVSRSSHGSAVVTPYIKILPERLDGEVQEVRFYSTSKTFGQNGGRDYAQSEWKSTPMLSVSPVNNYFTIEWGLMVGSDFGTTNYEGLFYVKTTKGTTYWVKSSNQGNFIFDPDVFSGLWSQTSGWAYARPLSTQKDSMRFYNPQNCY